MISFKYNKTREIDFPGFIVYILNFNLMIPASFAELKAISRSGPMIKPMNPKSFRPRYMAISVDSGESPIWLPITFGSTVRLMINKMTARTASWVPNAIFPVARWKIDHGASMTIEPINGIKSITQMIADITIAYFGVMKSKPIRETMKIITLTKN